MSINEELSFTEYTLTEDTTDFIISFDRIGGSTDEVSILVNNTPIEDLVGYTVLQVNFSTWQVDPALPAGTVVRLVRTTNLDKMVYVFTAGSKFIAKNVDDNFKQIQHSQQETRDSQDKLQADVNALFLDIQDVRDQVEQAVSTANSASALAIATAADIADTNLIVQSEGSQMVILSDSTVVPNMNKRIEDASGGLISHNVLLDRGAVGAHPASAILDASGQDQQQVNDYNGHKWRSKAGGYELNSRVTLADGSLVMSTVQGNTNNPNENLSGWRVVGNFKRIDLSGYKLTKDSDITALLSYVLSLSVFSPVEVILPHGEFLLNATVQTPNESLGVILDLNGSVLRPTSNANLMNNYTGQRYIVALSSNTEHPVVIKNGAIDGILREQNLFADTDYENSISVKRTDGVMLRGKHVAMQNLTVKNQFGVVSRFIGCNTIDVSDVIYENVGGLTAYGDIFLGDMFYIEMGAAGQESIQANFTNVNAIGKRSDQYPSNTMPTMFTRTGITLEGFAEQVESDVRINVVNCSFKNVQRWLHAETPQTVNVSIINSEIGSVLMLAGWNLHKLHADVSASDIQLYEGWYNNSYKGLGAAIGQASVSVTLDSSTVSHAGADNREAFGTWCTTKATNTKFNIYGKWAAHTDITLDDCYVEVKGNLATSNLTIGGSLKLTRTEVFYAGAYTEIWEHTENYYLKQCAFHNIDFDVGVTRNIEKLDDCRLVLTDTTKVKNKFWLYKDTYGFVLQYPKYFWGLSKSTLMDNKYTRDTYQKAGGSVSILPQWVKNLFNRYGLLLMVAKGCENTTHLLDDIGKPGGWKGYIVALASYDPFSDTYSFLTPRIYCGLIYEELVKGITVDDNFVITNFGTTVNFAEVAFVPYYEISSLPYVPPQLLSVPTP